LLSLVGVAVLAALALLVLEIRTDPAAGVDRDKLAAARAAHEQRSDAPPSLTPLSAPADESRPRPTPLPVPAAAPRSKPLLPVPAPSSLERPSLRGVAERPALRPMAVAPGASEPGGSRERLNRANKLYDHADYEGARDAALEILADQPQNVRMLRIVISTSCIMGDEQAAQAHFDRLEHARDRRHMRTRCSRFGVELESPE
jgi:hypothetical protein